MRLFYFLQQIMIGTYSIRLLLGSVLEFNDKPEERGPCPHGAYGFGFRLEHRL